MELRNRQVSHEPEDVDAKHMDDGSDTDSVFETANIDLSMDIDIPLDNTLLDNTPLDTTDTFLGDFEEIEEDEAVEQFISQTHTPIASNPHTPIASNPHTPECVDSVDNGESSDDDVFEEVVEKSEFDWYLNDVEVERLRELQQKFRQNNVHGVDGFLCPSVYKKYSVLAAQEMNMDAPVDATGEPAESTEAVRQVTQKPSSLRSGGRNEAKSLEAKSLEAKSPIKQTQRLDADDGSKQSEESDVVDTLLGAMSSPQMSSPQMSSQPGRQDAQVASDMLVAMMAVEGVEPKPEVSSETLAKAMATRLPKGYAGPFSQLTALEHAQYLSLVQRSKTSALSGRDASDLSRLRSRIDVEQPKFRAQAREQSLPFLRLVQGDVNAQMCHELGARAHKVLDAYPQQFRAHKVRTIRAGVSRYEPLEFKGMLFQRGSCAHVADAPRLSRVEWADEELVSQDEKAKQVAETTEADVVVSDTALAVLLALPQAHMRDVFVPFVVEEKNGENRGMRVIIDDQVVPPRSATPRVLNEMYYAQAARSDLVDPAHKLDLSEPSSEPGNATYTQWELNGQRLVIRYTVHAFSKTNGNAATVTFAAKVETQTVTSAEAQLSSIRGRNEEIVERERLAWWLAAYLRGNASHVRVAHVDTLGTVLRVTQHTAGDVQVPPTRALSELLRDLAQLPPGKYVLVHRRRTWDATVFRAVEGVDSRRSDAVLDLKEELADIDMVDAEAADVEGDYVPMAWHGMPGHVPYTYAPCDVEPFCSPPVTWNKPLQRPRRKQKKRKNKQP
ncbi:hypothetical protein GGH12_000698 [Coemansia sp. RSA 1822]|nr:hypothetical protein LPJ76_002833 [Coemansia sp. RSA 638]KAJ2540305.1 hypothetical protein GGF49_004549 [Coemansia sp. RSA 1853]KAJ2566740.1 hypothetical protein GGH12_000698 [Coemansia sp. RSA 1822]